MEKLGDFNNKEEVEKALNDMEIQKKKEENLIFKLSQFNPDAIEKEFYKGDKKYTDYATRNRNNKDNT